MNSSRARLRPIQNNGANSELKRSLKNSGLELDETPLFLQIMANSPASLRAFVQADAALVRGQLTPRQRQQIALAVAEINGASYRGSAQVDTGQSLGLNDHESQPARNAPAADPQIETMLSFTRAVVLQRGDISDEDFQALGRAGFTDAHMIEILANIALNIFSNYVNSVARTEADFALLQAGTDGPRIGISQSQTPATERKASSPTSQINGK
jgi:alkylhydroperoxidase family enzyme